MGQLVQIPIWLKTAIKTGIEFGVDALKNIFAGVPEAVAGIDLLSAPLLGSIDALSDENINDTEQLRAIWQSFLNKEVYEFTDLEVQEAIQEIDDENVREGLSALAVPLVQMLKVVTDENPNNTEQLRNMWADFVASDSTKRVFLENMIGPGLDLLSDQIRGEDNA